MDDFEKNNTMEISTNREPQGIGEPKNSGKPVSRFALLLVLFEVMVFAGLGIFYSKYCGGREEDDSESEDTTKPETDRDASIPKYRYILPRFIFRIMMFASKILFFLLSLFLPRNIRRAAVRAASRSDDGTEWGSLSKYSSEFLEQMGHKNETGRQNHEA